MRFIAHIRAKCFVSVSVTATDAEDAKRKIEAHRFDQEEDPTGWLFDGWDEEPRETE